MNKGLGILRSGPIPIGRNAIIETPRSGESYLAWSTFSNVIGLDERLFVFGHNIWLCSTRSGWVNDERKGWYECPAVSFPFIGNMGDIGHIGGSG
jgi:hypothetical protein